MGIRQIPNFKYQLYDPARSARLVRCLLSLLPSVRQLVPHQTTKSHKPRLFAQKSLRASGFVYSFPDNRLN
jgi:hypothetical protein